MADNIGVLPGDLIVSGAEGLRMIQPGARDCGHPLIRPDPAVGALGVSIAAMALTVDGSELAATTTTAGKLRMYDTTAGTYRESAGTYTPSTIYDLCTSSTRVAVATGSTPYVAQFAISDLSKFADLAVPPPGVCRCCRYSPDGSLLVIGHATTPFLSMYDTATGAKLANPAVLPGGTPYGVEFSPDGSVFYCAISGTQPSIYYDVATYTRVDLPGGNFLGTSKKSAISSDGTRLAITSQSSPYLRVYDLSGSAPALMTIPAGIEAALTIPNFIGTDTLLLTGPSFTQVIDFSSSPGVTLDVLPVGAGVTRACVVSGGSARYFAGTVKSAPAGPGIARRVLAVNRSTGRVVAIADSSAVDGTFSMRAYCPTECYTFALGDGAEVCDSIDGVAPAAL